MSEQSKVTMTEEVAMEEVRRWAEINDISLEVQDKDGNKVMDSAVPKLAKCVMSGRLVVNDEGDFEYTVSDRSPTGFAGEKLKLAAPNGAAYMGMDKFKAGQDVHKTLAVAAAVTGKDVAWFAKLDNRDYKIITIIISFFAAG